MGFTNDLTDGIARMLAGAGIGVYNPTGVYASTDVAIMIGTVPASPPQVICITPYSLPEANPDPYSPDELVGIQFWLRGANGDPRPVDDLEDQIYNALHGAENLMFGGAFVLMAWRHNKALMGQDPNARVEGVANYYLRVSHPNSFTL